MAERVAQCRCGAVEARCQGDPVRVSVCHCLICQQRSGSVLAVQARFAKEDVAILGSTKTFHRVNEEGTRSRFLFCIECGCTIAYMVDNFPDLVAIPVGAFADPNFPAPHYSVYEGRKHAWVAVVGPQIEHFD
jgi:hypothetical protein